MSTSPKGPILILTRKPLRQRRLDCWFVDAEDGVCLVASDAVLDRHDDELQKWFLAVETVPDYHSWELELIAERLARTYAVTRICSSSEDDVLRAAVLRERLGLPGQSVRSATAFRDKVTMKATSSAAGVAVPEFAPVDGPIELVDFVRCHGLPVVVKPRRGAGSEDVHIVRTTTEFDEFLRSGAMPAAPERSGTWMVEAFIDAPLYHVDGVAVGGKLVHGWPSRYSSGNAEATFGGTPLASVQLSADDAATAKLLRFTDQVLRALPASPFAHSVHLEAWLPLGSTEPVLCEVAARTGGGAVAQVYQLAFGLHPSRESLRGQAGLPTLFDRAPSTPSCYAGWVAFTPRDGVFERPHDSCPVPGVELKYTLESGAKQRGPVHAGDGAALAVVQGASSCETSERIDAVMAWWEEQAPWS